MDITQLLTSKVQEQLGGLMFQLQVANANL